MSDHPTTFAGESASSGAFEWSDPAALHRSDDGGGVLGGFKAIRHGTVAELVHFVASLPADERARYRIEKAGDRSLGPAEIAALAARPDLP